MESIVACAAARAGKSVLHLDSNEYYGHENTSTNLADFLSSNKKAFEDTCLSFEVNKALRSAGIVEVEEASKQDQDQDQDVQTSMNFNSACLHAETEIETESGEVIQIQLNNSDDVKIAKQMVIDFKCMSNDENAPCISSTTIFSRKSEKIHPACLGYIMDKNVSSATTTVKNTHPAFFGYRKDSTTLTPNRAVFKSREFCLDTAFRPCLAAGISVDSMISSDVGKYLEFKTVDAIYYINDANSVVHVPSSKSDIFSSSLLHALEKRSLMKFLQFAMDRGQSFKGNEVSTLNERELMIGRALRRPQNKGVDVNDYYMYDSIPFHEYLKINKVSDKLQNIIVHALCFHEKKFKPNADDDEYDSRTFISTVEALNNLHQNIDSIGRFGTTPFITPVYGSTEISQAFCRMCAVWGGTYILRRHITKFSFGFGLATKKENDSDSTEQKQKQKGEVAALSLQDSTGKKFSCGAFVCNIEYWPKNNNNTSHSNVESKTKIITRVSICDASVFLIGISMGIIPPKTQGLDNPHSIYIFQLDSTSNVVPAGAVVIHIMTSLEFEEDDISLENKDFAVSLLQNTIKFLKVSANFTEMCAATTLRPLYDFEELSSELPVNVAVCGQNEASIDIRENFTQAKTIFQKLFPTEQFLPLDAHQNDQQDAESDSEESLLERLVKEQEYQQRIESKSESDHTKNDEDDETNVAKNNNE